MKLLVVFLVWFRLCYERRLNIRKLLERVFGQARPKGLVIVSSNASPPLKGGAEFCRTGCAVSA